MLKNCGQYSDVLEGVVVNKIPQINDKDAFNSHQQSQVLERGNSSGNGMPENSNKVRQPLYKLGREKSSFCLCRLHLNATDGSH